MDVVNDINQGRIVLLGDPGLGKSTLLKKLLLHWAENQVRPLAVFLELRRVVDQFANAQFLEYLEHGSEQTCCLPRAELDQHLRANASLLLFDGLDEVTPGLRAIAIESIIRFADDYPLCRVIVTTRINGYNVGSTHPERFRDAGFEQYTLQDFQDSEIHEFIRLWHNEAFTDVLERKRFRIRLEKAVRQSRTIRELAANPLLLTMMAILSRNQDLPRDRARLYERCAELLLKSWDLEKCPEKNDRTGALDIKDKLGPDQKMRILEQVAAAMEESPTGLSANLISEDRLREIVVTALESLAVLQPWSVAEDLIWMLRERNFMLAYLGDREYGFIHRTFLEYFSARNLKYRLEKLRP